MEKSIYMAQGTIWYSLYIFKGLFNIRLLFLPSFKTFTTARIRFFGEIRITASEKFFFQSEKL